MWGTLIAAAVTAAAKITSAVVTKRKNRRLRDEQKALAEKNRATAQSLYQGLANQNPLTAYQGVINQYDKEAMDAQQTAEKKATILGYTPNTLVATQKAIAQGKADMLGKIGDQHERKKEKYLAESANAEIEANNQKAQADFAYEQNSINQFGKIMDGVADIAGGIASGIGGGIKAKIPSKTTTEVIGENLTKQQNALQQQKNLFRLEKSTYNFLKNHIKPVELTDGRGKRL